VEDDHVPVLTDDVGAETPHDDAGARPEDAPERLLSDGRPLEDGCGDGQPDESQQDEVHREGDVDQHLCRPAAVQFGVAVGGEEGQRVREDGPGDE
jgi:hypothetical protein